MQNTATAMAPASRAALPLLTRAPRLFNFRSFLFRPDIGAFLNYLYHMPLRKTDTITFNHEQPPPIEPGPHIAVRVQAIPSYLGSIDQGRPLCSSIRNAQTLPSMVALCSAVLLMAHSSVKGPNSSSKCSTL